MIRPRTLLPFPTSSRRAMAVTTLAVAGLLGVAWADGPSTLPTGQKRTTPSGLTIIDQGQSDLTVQDGDKVTVHYTGKLEDGTVFDSSLTRGDPFTFTVGQTRVIQGWQEGLLGMKAGDRRQLIIPGKLGYGENGAPPKIPPNATLIFDIQLLYVSRPEAGK